MEPIVGTIALVVALAALLVARVNRVVPWRSVVRIAAATGSLRACVEFIRFCGRS